MPNHLGFRGWTVDRVYVDNDVSASRRRRRPAFEELLEHVAEGRYQVLLALDLDRLTHARTVTPLLASSTPALGTTSGSPSRMVGSTR